MKEYRSNKSDTTQVIYTNSKEHCLERLYNTIQWGGKCPLS